METCCTCNCADQLADSAAAFVLSLGQFIGIVLLLCVIVIGGAWLLHAFLDKR